MKNKKSDRKYLITIILVIALIVLSFLIYNKSNGDNDSDLNNYKKALYESVLCQYSCPLIEQEFNNITQYLPLKPCVESCINQFRALGLNDTKFSDETLINDNLVKDIEITIRNCKLSSSEEINNSQRINNEIFFKCSVDGLNSIKSNYTYLN